MTKTWNQIQSLLEKVTTSQKTGIFFLVLLVVSTLGQNAFAMIPWYAQDYHSRLTDYPELVRLVDDEAIVFIENTAGGVGDAALFEAVSDTPAIGVYLNMTGAWYDNSSWRYDDGNDFRDKEELFYHSADPSLLQGWRDSSTGATLRWDWDYRFVPFTDLDDLITDSVVDTFKIYRRIAGAAEFPTTEYGVVADTTVFVDVGLSVSDSYEYKITSVHDGLEYEFTLDENAVTVDTVVYLGPRFWHERVRFQEFVLNQIRGVLQSPVLSSPFDWPLTIRYSGDFDPALMKLQYWTQYRPHHTEETSFQPETIDWGPINFDPIEKKMEFSIDEATLGLNIPDPHEILPSTFMRAGGYSYRFVYDAGGANIIYPSVANSGQEQFIRTSVNNRLFPPAFKHYMMNVERETNEWRNFYTDMVEKIDNGVEWGGQQVSFEALFADVVNDHLIRNTYNYIEPIEYEGQASYEDGVVGILDEIASRANIDLDLYLNCWSLKILDRVKENDRVVGAVKENWTKDSSWNQNLLPALWVTHASGTNLRLCLLEHQQEIHNTPTHRHEILAAYMLTKNANAPDSQEELLGYGDWSPEGENGVTEEMAEMVKVLPEQMIGIGSPIDDPYASVAWPTATAIDGMSTNSQINWLQSNAPSLFTGAEAGRIFARRRFQHIDGMNNDKAIWAAIDVEAAPAPPGMVSFSEIIGDCSVPFYYVVDFSSTPSWENVLLTEGAGFRTTEVPCDEQWQTVEGLALIFFEQPVESPTIGDDFYNPHAAKARYVLPVSATQTPLLVVRATQWNGQELTEVRIAVDRAAVSGGSVTSSFTDVGWPTEIILIDNGLGGDREANDDFYTWQVTPMVAAGNTVPVGTYDFPIVVTGSDGLMRYGSVEVRVVEDTGLAFQNRSVDTGELGGSTTGVEAPYASAAWDYNGDDKIDLFVSQHIDDSNGEPLRGQMYEHTNLNAGAPVFVKRTAVAFPVEPPIPGNGIAVMDFDGVGAKDFFLAGGGTGPSDQSQLFINDNGIFKNEADSIFVNGIPAQVHAADWGDYNKDGLPDLILARAPNIDFFTPQPPVDGQTSPMSGAGTGYGEQPVLLRHNDRGNSALGSLVPQNWLGPDSFPDDQHYSYEVTWVDINNDGLLDIFVADAWTDQSAALLINNLDESTGVHSFIDETASWFAAGSLLEGVRSAAFLRQNGECVDIVTTHWGLDDNLTVYHKTGGQFVEVDKSVANIPVEPLSLNGLVVGDFDGNNMNDILVLPYLDPQEPYILSNGVGGGHGVFSRLSGVDFGLGRANGAVVADWGGNPAAGIETGDGDYDIFMGRNSTTDQAFFFENTSVSSLAKRRFKIRLLGADGDTRPGQGALVEVLDPANNITKKMLRAGGRGSSPLELSFVLQDYVGSTVDVQITWPRGYVQTATCTMGVNNIIEDDSYFIDGNSVTSSHVITPSGMDWIFEWVTRGPTPKELDVVHVVGETDIYSSCYCGGEFDLYEAMSAVDVTITQEAGGWRHKLVWHDGCCVVQKPACNTTFDVLSANRLGEDTSILHTFLHFKVCGFSY